MRGKRGAEEEREIERRRRRRRKGERVGGTLDREVKTGKGHVCIHTLRESFNYSLSKWY